MPFELGIDVGCIRFKGGKWSQKKCLILEAAKYRYQAALSDMSNSDIAVHKKKPAEVARAVRNWLRAQTKVAAPGPARVWGAFNDFMAYNYASLVTEGHSPRDIERLPADELIWRMQAWVTTSA
jgi:hypothetical protein